jgi:putative endonuclease
MWNYNFYVYIITNPEKTVLYIGVTNNLIRRLQEHTENKGNDKTFAGKYYCYNLVYYEHFDHIEYAIAREKELKKWSRKKKDALIQSENPQWRFLNAVIME